MVKSRSPSEGNMRFGTVENQCTLSNRWLAQITPLCGVVFFVIVITLAAEIYLNSDADRLDWFDWWFWWETLNIQPSTTEYVSSCDYVFCDKVFSYQRVECCD